MSLFDVLEGGRMRLLSCGPCFKKLLFWLVCTLASEHGQVSCAHSCPVPTPVLCLALAQ